MHKYSFYWLKQIRFAATSLTSTAITAFLLRTKAFRSGCPGFRERLQSSTERLWRDHTKPFGKMSRPAYSPNVLPTKDEDTADNGLGNELGQLQKFTRKHETSLTRNEAKPLLFFTAASSNLK